MSIRTSAVLFLAGLALAAHGEQFLQFRTVKGGTNCRVTQAEHKVLRTPEEFANYWSDAMGSTPLPKGLDWSKNELVAVHLGHRGSFGYQISVRSVARVGDATVVHWVERVPMTNSDKRAAQTSPYVIVSFPSQPGKVRFEGSVEDPRHPYDTGDAYPKLIFLSGGHCLMKSETTYLISSKKEMADMWRVGFGRATPPPDCDFNKWRLAAIFLGQRPTPGYTPVIDRIARIGPHEVQVRYSETKPAPGTILPQLVTNPFVILKLPVGADEITIEKTT
ncbi:MAG TPA: protease complex subunit PrcB family protein [Fimbriimonadaceae bacterium]|nr:protease complex subunit PrcB family protein [Fimbriimonadaceae bacterium]